MGFEGGPCQKIWLRRGPAEKIWCVKGGGVTNKMPLSLVVTASVIMQTSARMPKNSISKVLKIQIKQMQD